jgi:S-adenosylmethionine decarboxylase proenzyme
MYHLGIHMLVELYECDRELLNDPVFIEKAMKKAAVESGATIVSCHTNLFNPYGVSGVVIIAESHITIHTWPEHGYAAVDAFTCGDSVSPLKVKEVLEKLLKAGRSTMKDFKRGEFDYFVEYSPMSKTKEAALETPDK